MNVKLIRMSSGEDLIADVINDQERDIIVVENPIVGFPSGEGTLGFAPWSPMLSKSEREIQINRHFIVYIAEADPQIVEQYQKMFSTVITPSKKIIV
jgi:hypothetical protein